MRCEYKFTAFLVCTPSYAERNVVREEDFVRSIETHPGFKQYADAVRSINGSLKLAMGSDSLTSILLHRIENFKPVLACCFELREMKGNVGDFVGSERGQAYFRAWQTYLKKMPFHLVPTKLWRIPLPYQTEGVD